MLSAELLVDRDAGLVSLIEDLFDAASLRRFVALGPLGKDLLAELPSEMASLATLAFEVASLWKRHGLIEAGLFARLEEQFPFRGMEIGRVRLRWLGASRLLVLVDPDGRRWEIGAGAVTVIGRDPTANVRIPESAAKSSRRHALVERRSDHFMLVDCSKNGTYLNDQRIEAAKLNHGDRIRVGTLQFTVEDPQRTETE